MTELSAISIPILQIRIVNPRTRNRVTWLSIVASIKAVGLKKPITVARRDGADEAGCTFDLICGQGRLEAFQALGEQSIPAIITEAGSSDRALMSLVENIARRPPSNRALYLEVQTLLRRGHTAAQIANKLGIERSQIVGIVQLVQHGEEKLLQAVEGGRLPLSVAVQVIAGNDQDVQQALSDGYLSGELRGAKLRVVRRIIKERDNTKATMITEPERRALSSAQLVSLYKERVSQQQRLVLLADQAKRRSLTIVSAMKNLLADEDFHLVLEAENLLNMPEQLLLQIQ